MLGQRHLKPWQLFVWVKGLELWFHLRPGRLRALLGTRSRFRKRQLLWVLLHIGLVWLGEVVEFLSPQWSRPLVPVRPQGALVEGGALISREFPGI